MNYNSFPIQKLPYNRKTKTWREDCVKFIISCAESNTFSENRVSRQDMKAYYDLYNSIYDERRLKYVTNPWKQQDGFPATAQNINIIKPQIDLLLGEEVKRPFNFTVIRTSDTVTTEVQDKMSEMLMDYMMSALYANMSEEEAMIHQEKLQTGEIQLPEEIASYYNKSYKDVAESIAYKTLRYLKQDLNIDNEFHKGMKDAVISTEEIYYVGANGNRPVFERVNPLLFYYEYSPDLEFIHEASWCARKMILSNQEIYDMFYDKLSDSDLNNILLKVQSGDINNKAEHDARWNFREIMNNTFDATMNPGLLNVWHACWQSYKKIGFVTLVNEEGEMEEVQVDESYYETGEEISVEWEWAIETWEGYYVDDELMFGIQPIDYQYISSSSFNSCRLPYTGTVYSNTNSTPKSFVSFLEPLQYTYIMLWYRLELALARDKGKVLTVDITQIPKSYDIDVAKWMHMLSALGVNLINPYEEGWDVPGRSGGRAAGFNQFDSEDLSMSNTIVQYIELLDKVEQMAGSLTGITPQRQGAISSRELVGNVERSIIQSSNITEHLFWKHNNVKREALNMLLNTAKNIWSVNPPNSLHYVLDDGERIFLNINDDFLYSDFDIFVSDSSEEMLKLQQLEGLYQPAMQNGATLSDIAEIMTLDNITKIKEKLTEVEQRRQELEDSRLRQEQEAAMQLEEARRQTVELQIQDKQADRDLKKYQIDMDNQTKIQIAQIGAYRFQEDLDADGDGIPDPIQIGELAIKQLDADAKRKDLENSRSIKKQEINSKEKIEKAKADAAMRLQKQKDDAAMARERVKAKTALRNKVSGEK